MTHDHGSGGLEAAFGHPRGLAGVVGGLLLTWMGRPANRNRWLVKVLNLTGDEQALDLGCGPGTAVAAAAARLDRGHVVGVDSSPEMVALATWRNRDHIRHGRATIRCAHVTDLPAAEASVDVAWASFSYHHWEEPAVVLAEVARVLKPGGLLALTERGDEPGIFPGPPGFGGEQVTELSQLLRDAGFAEAVIDRCRVGRQTVLLVRAHTQE